MKNKAFTLIELLVVIAIIGMLSSIVLVNTRSARDKARIAKALEFSQSINNVLGAEAVGIWNFDGCNANDSSGYNNNGTIHGATCSTDTPYSVVGQDSQHSMSFDGVDDYMFLADMGQDGLTSYSFESWVYRTIDQKGTIMHIATGGDYSNIYIGIEANEKPFLNWHGNDWSADYTLTNNRWYHIVWSYDNQYRRIYVDGELKDSDSQIGKTFNFNVAYMGSISSGTSQTYGGNIDEFRIYLQALTSFEIQQHYAEGLEKHRGLVIK